MNEQYTGETIDNQRFQNYIDYQNEQKMCLEAFFLITHKG